MEEINQLKQKVDSLKVKIESAKRRGDLSMVADLQYYALPEAQRRIEQLQLELQQQKDKMLTEIVGPEQIAGKVFVIFYL